MVLKTQAPVPVAAGQSQAPSRLLGSLRWARHRLRALRTENRRISRYVFNAAPVYRYRRVAGQQPPEVRRVADELRASGVALTSMSSLLSSDASLRVLQDHVARTRAERTAERDSLKPYLIELFGAQPEISLDDPVFAFALLPQVRGVAEAYAQMELRVQDINVWINLPTGGGPTQSQRWHRDLPDDYDIVKCFVYLADVTPGAGPLQYIRSTNTSEGRRQSFRSEFDGVGYRVADDDIESTYPQERVVTAEGPAGTIVFADTRGLHRGGFASSAERVVLQITYSSNASVRRRNLRPASGTDRSALRDYRLMAGVR